MKFDLIRPCSDCPFRTDRPGFLGQRRAQQIVDHLLKDDYRWFGCHKTTMTAQQENGSSDRGYGEETQQCVGSLRLLLAIDATNVPTRLAVALGNCNLDALDHSVPVFATVQAFVDHHSLES